MTVVCPSRDPTQDPDSGLRVGAELGTWSNTGVAMLEIRIGYLGNVLSGGGTGFKPCLWAVKTFKNALF